MEADPGVEVTQQGSVCWTDTAMNREVFVRSISEKGKPGKDEAIRPIWKRHMMAHGSVYDMGVPQLTDRVLTKSREREQQNRKIIFADFFLLSS